MKYVPRISTGLENLLSNQLELVKNRKLGVLAHPASITSKFEHVVSALKRKNSRIISLFGPEHGFDGEAQDMESVDGVDEKESVQIFSLYGKDEQSLSPSFDSIKELDALVVDLFDVGSRYYTFVWTAVLCLRVCHKAGVQMILLDRPNPIGGVKVEGGVQDEGFLSFVGLVPIPNRHGMTVGEIVNMVARNEGLSDVLRIVPMVGWKRDMEFGETGLPWVAPSPNMPTLQTAKIYPGGCLLEATWASEGRGTTMPFELFGAPDIDNEKLCSNLNKLKMPGVFFRQTSFKPMFQKNGGLLCKGAQLHVTDDSFEPYKTGVAIISELYKCAPDQFEWRREPYEFVSKIHAIDLLTGNKTVRKMIEQDCRTKEIFNSWKESEDKFKTQIKEFHLY